MINSLSHHPATATTADRSPLVDQLARRADTNRDGAVSTAEFDAFLSDLMQALDSDDRTRTDNQTPPSAAVASAPAPAAPAGAHGPAGPHGPHGPHGPALQRAIAAVTRER